MLFVSSAPEGRFLVAQDNTRGPRAATDARSLGFASVTLAVLISFAVPGHAAQGDPDAGFGTDGLQISGTPRRDRAYGLTVLSDGSVIAVGNFGRDIGISRYRPNGSLDASFQPQQVGNAVAAETAHAVFVGPESTLLIAGTSEVSNQSSLLYKKVRTGNDATELASRTITLSSQAGTFATQRQADGMLVSAGYSGPDGRADFLVIRVNGNTDFSSDNLFDNDGLTTTDLGGNDIAYGIALQSDGKVVVAGQSDARGTIDFALARYNVDGSLDTSFGTNGFVLTDVSSGGSDEVEGLSLQADGKILVAGSTTTGTEKDIALVRYNTNGTLDATFGRNGIVITDVGSKSEGAFSVTALASGKIVIAGYTEAPGDRDMLMVRYRPGGALDRTFGIQGATLVGTPGKDETAFAQALQVDGSLFVVGTSTFFDRGDFAAAKLKDVDPPSCTRPTIVGTEGDDVLVGTPGPDVIVGLGGNDQINGLGGNDLICGGPGNDVLRGGGGRDRLLGEAGDDQLSGQGGDDMLKGGTGRDTLNGGAGVDSCRGTDKRNCEG